jgi:pyruvate formate lyase activating enzyme
MSADKGIIFNIQKFSIHDGSGIRTLVFMKGCPLNCLWCSNPESQISDIEIMDIKTNCIGCGKCVELCESRAINPDSFDIDRSLCTKCGKCTEYCFANAKKKVGDIVTIRELMKTINKDRVFYRNSGGGVTVGGGEPLMQSDFVANLLKHCKDSNIHTAIETCGYGKWNEVKKVFEYADQIFFDIKSMDPILHEKYTGVSNEIILENAKRVAELKKETIYRIPVIPGLNDDKENITETGEFVKKLYEINDNISVELLPYHNLGADKYRWLGNEYKMPEITKPDDKAIEEYKTLLKENGLRVL